MPLTVLELRKIKPAASNVKVYDSGGLYMLVQPNGARYWRFEYRYAGKEKLLAIGVFPEISLAKARAKRDEARKRLDDGFDPGTERKEEKRLLAFKAQNTFDAIGREWWDTKRSGSTILNEHGFRPDVIERQLAHAERNKIRAAYHRSEYLPERRKMMQHWADYLDAVKEKGKVIPMIRAASVGEAR